MEWAEVSFRTSHEAVDAVSSLFEEAGASGTVIEDPALINEYIHSGLWDYTDIPEQKETSVVTVKAYLAADDALDDKLASLHAGLDAIAARGVDTKPAEFLTARVQDEDWANSWKAYFHTDKVGERVVIQPSWEEYEPQPDEVVLRLDPGAAFGTGTHPTTSMCLRAMEKLVKPGMTVFDVGTGSGVLAIAAAKLGAGTVRAVDYDATAVRVARENIEANGAQDVVSTAESDLFSALPGKAALVTANLIADLVIRLLPELDAHLETGGALLASGIIESRAQEVREAAETAGFFVAEDHEEKEWHAMVIRRRGDA